MYQSLDLFQTAADMARHAGARQALTARNVANADTPGYVAQHMRSFQDSYADAPAAHMFATRSGHFMTTDQAGTALLRDDAATEPSPNGNAVSIEEEMMNAVEISREHSRALAIYQHAMTVLRISLGR
jgi:flagellar basal-body rod protein FlgB